MIYLQCTKQVRRMLGLENEALQEAPSATSILGNWTVNYVPIGKRHAFLFMSDRTLLSFPILEGQLAFEPQDMPKFLAHGLAQVLKMAGLSEQDYARLLNDTDTVAFAKAGNRSILGVYRALADDYNFRTDRAGGIERCNLAAVIAQVNQTPRAKLKFATSFEVTRALLLPGIGSVHAGG